MGVKFSRGGPGQGQAQPVLALPRASVARDDHALRPDPGQTHEAEFLRYRKLTADARELKISARDLYDMLQLDQRTDRILPNGWCLLPPRQSCDRRNACFSELTVYMLFVRF